MSKRKPERYFSPEARERIASAQRKRWRKWRKEQKAGVAKRKRAA